MPRVLIVWPEYLTHLDPLSASHCRHPAGASQVLWTFILSKTAASGGGEPVMAIASAGLEGVPLCIEEGNTDAEVPRLLCRRPFYESPPWTAAAAQPVGAAPVNLQTPFGSVACCAALNGNPAGSTP